MKINVWFQKTEHEEIEIEFPLYTRWFLAEDYIVYNRLDADGTLISIRKDNVSIMISRTMRDMGEALDASLVPDHETGDRACTVEEFTEMLDEVRDWLQQAYRDVAEARPSGWRM